MQFEWKMTLGTLIQLIVLGVGGFIYVGTIKTDVAVISAQVAFLTRQVDKIDGVR